MEALLLLYSVKVLLLFLPIRKVTAIFQEPKLLNRKSDVDQLNDIKWSLQKTDRLVPWKNRCLVKSIAGRWMLHHRGISSTLHFGVRHDENRKIKAHAWLKSGDYEIVPAGTDYEELLND